MHSQYAPSTDERGGIPVELVIFDCDGVLINSEVISLSVLAGLLGTYSISIDNSYFTRQFLGRSFSHVREKVSLDFGVTLPDTFEQHYLSTLMQRFDKELTPVDGIEDVLSQLNVPFCLATSSHRERTDRALKATGLAKYFSDNIYTASQVKRGKPEPDLFLFAASEQGFAPQNCLVIEDSLHGLRADTAAGMQVWHFQGGAHMPSAIGDISLPDGVSRVVTHWSQFFSVLPELRNNIPS